MNESLSRLHWRLIALLVAVVPAWSGCAWHAPAASDRQLVEAAARSNISDWPMRCRDKLDEIIRIAPDVLSIRVKHDTVVDGKLVKSPKRLPAAEGRFSGLFGRGIIRHFKEESPKGRVLSEGLCFFSGVEVPPSVAVKRNLVKGPAEDLGEGRWVVNMRGTWLRLDMPTNGPCRGLVVHLTSYGGYEYEKPVIQEMRDRGWALLWVDSSMVKPETVHIDVDPEDLPWAANQIATVIDDRLAEAAYAVEGGIDYVKRERPEVPLAPMVIMGYSAGALATPTVVSLMPDRFEAAVIVGAGANLFDVSQNSALTDGGIKLHWKRPASQSHRRELTTLYLKSSRLDPYWASQYMRDKPVLMLHAVLDQIVPAADGDLLYERLGRPERVNFFLGHELLFLNLPRQKEFLADWVDETLKNRPRGSEFAAK
jgi:hypothetical protein